MAIPLLTKVANFRCSPERYKQFQDAVQQIPWVESFSDLVQRALQDFLRKHLPLNGDLGAIQEPEKVPGPEPAPATNGKPSQTRPRPAKEPTAKKSLLDRANANPKKPKKAVKSH